MKQTTTRESEMQEQRVRDYVESLDERGLMSITLDGNSYSEDNLTIYTGTVECWNGTTEPIEVVAEGTMRFYYR